MNKQVYQGDLLVQYTEEGEILSRKFQQFVHKFLEDNSDFDMHQLSSELYSTLSLELAESRLMKGIKLKHAEREARITKLY